MSHRLCTLLLLLGALLATQLLDVHFHLPPAVSGEPVHVVAPALIDTHQHAGEPDHGHLAAHLYEGELDEGEITGLFAQLGFALLLGAALLRGLLRSLPWGTAVLPIAARNREAPPRPRRLRTSLSPPSQAPPLHG